jgi:hypothetical protein
MLAMDNARRYDWPTWWIGIFRSFISGGAAALASLTGSGIAGLTLKQTLTMTGSSFVVMGLYRLGEFLQLHGAPEKLQQSLDHAAAATKEASAAISEAKSAATEVPPKP